MTAGAIDAIARALTGEPRVRFVSGEIRRSHRGLELDPAALVTDRVIVPDLEPPRPLGLAFPAPAPDRSAAPIEGAALEASSALEEACHSGLARVSPGWSERASAAALRLEEVGLRAITARLEALVLRVADLRRDRSHASAAASAWLAASIRVALLREAL